MTHDTPPKRIWEDRMTDLTRERIEEIKKWKSLFDRGEVVNFLSVGETHDLARQLLAAMTERDEAQAAARAETERLREALDKAFLAIVEARSHADPGSLFRGLNDLLGKVDDIRRTALSQEAGT